MAAAAVAGARDARARDATCLELLVCSFIYIYYFTNVYFRSTECVEMAMAAAAAVEVQDTAGKGDRLGIKGA